MLVLFVFAVLVVCALAQQQQQCTVGSFGCACSSNSNCDKPLSCVAVDGGSKVCVCLVGAPGCTCAAGRLCEASGSKCGEDNICDGLVLSPPRPEKSFLDNINWFGLEWFYWAGIIGGGVLCVIFVIVGVCVACKKKDNDMQNLYIETMHSAPVTYNASHATAFGDSMGPDAIPMAPPPNAYNEPVLFAATLPPPTNTMPPPPLATSPSMPSMPPPMGGPPPAFAPPMTVRPPPPLFN
eukprot:TRINITY_DN4696_c0_g1_i1.p1 TRINITY_DN4696_c0_g1~~TRINITY_DN4696_c0_g1_i1.p1  ORF type:complete len:238 (+),score=65.44 TRINITY_DN4696_c0_g1_i1:65-778(+)